MKVALGQIDLIKGDPPANLAAAHEAAAKAAAAGAELLVLPELWSTAYDLRRADQHAAPLGEGIFAETSALSAKHQLAVVGSCISRLESGGFGNTAVFYDRNGRALGDYSKLHLFSLMDEDQYLTAGDAPTLIDTHWGKIGLAICYDLRFPELFRRYALAGAKMVIIPAEWPHPRLAHWRTLLRARAIENQMYIVACNRVGTAGETHFFGHSCVIDPWGEIIVEGDEAAVLLTAEIDFTLVDEVRAKIPVFRDRRPDHY